MRVKAKNELKLILPALSENESLARSVIAAFVSQLDPRVDELVDIRTAVSEAVTNCIVHAYPDRAADIVLTARSYDNGRVVIRIQDHGCGIDDIEQAREPLFTTGGEERSGLGFSVMESLCDRVRVTSTCGKGTVVVLEKYITQEEEAAPS